MEQDQVTDLLMSALAAVRTAEIPEGLQEAAFTSALQLLVGAESAASPAVGRQSGAGDLRSQASARLSSATSGSELLDKIAAGLELDPERLRNIFAERDGAPELIIRAASLPKAKAAAARDIALLVMAARQLGDLDDYTDAETLRETVKRYGRFDESNFGQHMRALDNFILTSGKGANAQRKLTHPGIEAASELAKRYLGDE